MSRHELGMTLNYVSKWGFVEAVREIFQNALDAEKESSKSKMFTFYDSKSEVLRIGNKHDYLDKSSLLLGLTSKSDKKNQIGQFGEGYKIATAVLLRIGCGLSIINSRSSEVWTAKIVNSRRYKEKIPVFDIEKTEDNSADKDSLVFVITGVTSEMYSKVVESNIHLMMKESAGIGDYKESKMGKVLLDSRFTGRLFVGGLFIRKMDGLRYGYDFAPELITLDRDRDLIENFQLKWSIAKLLRGIDKEFVATMVNVPDAEYLFSAYWDDSESKEFVASKTFSSFRKENGNRAVPCKSTEKFNEVVKQGHKAVLVSEPVFDAIACAPEYTKFLESDDFADDTPLIDKISAWYDEAKGYLSESLITSGNALLKELKNVL